MRRTWLYRAFTALILCLCLVPSAGMLLRGEGDAGASGGNETLAALPSLRGRDGKLNRAWPDQLRDYAGDHYFLRKEMISAWSALNASLLGSSITEDVVLGREGWLYFGDTLPDYTGTGVMSREEAGAAAVNLRLMSEACQSQGRQFLFTIAPNKNSLYPEHMPDLPVREGPRNRDLLAEALAREGVAYLDLFAVFGEQEETLYFPRDSHWNSQGAALAADAVNRALGRTSAYFQGPFAPAPGHKGDLYDMLSPAGPDTETDMAYQPGLSFEYDAPIRSAENLTIMTHGGGAGSLLMFRDSFGNLLYPYLADSTGSALFSRSVPYRLDLAAEREADWVVLELVERNLGNLTASVPLTPAPAREAPETEEGPQAAAVSLTASEDLPGFVLAEGRLPFQPEPGTPVLAETDRGWFEAFQLADRGFGLYLPEGTALRALVLWDGGSLGLRCPVGP